MASLTIRKLDDQTYERLKDRAARDGVSMEEEVRRILARAVAPPGRLGDLFLKTFGPPGASTSELRRANRTSRRRSSSRQARAMIILDTNVVTEVMKASPPPAG